MRVLVACEFSGTVRDAFTALGHHAVSCDLLPSEKPGMHHEGDIFDVIYDNWELMICHPPCTYLASSGLHWNKRIPGREEKTADALEFVRKLLAAPVPRIALENPVGRIGTAIRKADQTIQPWMFGHDASKATQLWLKGLPRLTPTQVLLVPEGGRWANQTASGQNKLAPSPDRWKERSRTYQGVADAMAAQWGRLTIGEPL